MKTVYDEAIDMLMKDGYPRDLLVRFINACIKNYESDEQIINDLKSWVLPADLKNNEKYLSERIYLLKNRTYFQEAMEIYPRLTDEVIDRIQNRKFIE